MLAGQMNGSYCVFETRVLRAEVYPERFAEFLFGKILLPGAGSPGACCKQQKMRAPNAAA